MAIDLNALRDFEAVVRHGGFTGAASALRIPKSTVSARVAALEEGLGVRLLERTTRSVRLTEEGAAFHERAARIIAEAEEAEQALKDRSAAPKGHLRVSAPFLFGDLLLGQFAAEFLAAHPMLSLDIVLSDRRVDLVEDNFDIAIRVGALDDAAHVARIIALTRQRLVHAAELKARLKVPEDLADKPCILFTTGGPQRRQAWAFHNGKTEKRVKVDGPLALNGLGAIRKAALAGAGYALVPEFIVADDLRAGRLVSALDAWTGTPIEVRALYQSRRLLSARIRAFIDALVAAFPERRLG